MMDRRTCSAARLPLGAASLISTRGKAAASTPLKATTVVLVHPRFVCQPPGPSFMM